MKHLFITLSTLLLLSCQKIKENVQEDLVIKAMTDGQWRITKFNTGSTDNTADFAAYKFQFRSNNTVEAIHNGSTERTGTWSADPNNRTITSAFNNAPAPLQLLNGMWKITANSWTFVEANQTVNGVVLSLRLDK